MSGIYGNSQEDRYFEGLLNKYLDGQEDAPMALEDAWHFHKHEYMEYLIVTKNIHGDDFDAAVDDYAEGFSTWFKETYPDVEIGD